MTDRRTIVFFPESAYGPTNNCVGIGNVLRERGPSDRVRRWRSRSQGRMEAKGFEERLMRLGPPPAEPEVPGQFWIDFIRDTSPVFRKSTFEQLGEFIAPTWQALIDGSKYVDPRLAEIFDEVAPDVIVEDNVVGVPGHRASRAGPWVRIVSCNPIEVKDPAARARSRPATRGRPADWPSFLDEVRRTHGDMWADFDAFCRAHGETGLVVRRPRAGLHRRVPVPEPLLVPGRGRLRARATARADLAPPRLHGPGAPRRPGSCPTTWPSGTGR